MFSIKRVDGVCKIVTSSADGYRIGELELAKTAAREWNTFPARAARARVKFKEAWEMLGIKFPKRKKRSAVKSEQAKKEETLIYLRDSVVPLLKMEIREMFTEQMADLEKRFVVKPVETPWYEKPILWYGEEAEEKLKEMFPEHGLSFEEIDDDVIVIGQNPETLKQVSLYIRDVDMLQRDALESAVEKIAEQIRGA